MTNANITPAVSTNYEVGAILVDSWGWEQTNIEFYCIIKRTGDFVTVLPMKKNSESKDFFATMTKSNTPGEIDFSAKPIRKKVKKFDGKESGFSFRDYTGGGWCNLWDGEPEISSHYA